MNSSIVITIPVILLVVLAIAAVVTGVILLGYKLLQRTRYKHLATTRNLFGVYGALVLLFFVAALV